MQEIAAIRKTGDNNICKSYYYYYKAKDLFLIYLSYSHKANDELG
jgi:hypothetical protein